MAGCYKCGKEGHNAKNCHKGGGYSGGNRKGGYSGGEGRACYECGKEGHFARDCPTGGGFSRRPKYSCGEEGHIANNCTAAGAPNFQDSASPKKPKTLTPKTNPRGGNAAKQSANEKKITEQSGMKTPRGASTAPQQNRKPQQATGSRSDTPASAAVQATPASQANQPPSTLPKASGGREGGELDAAFQLDSQNNSKDVTGNGGVRRGCWNSNVTLANKIKLKESQNRTSGTKGTSYDNPPEGSSQQEGSSPQPSNANTNSQIAAEEDVSLLFSKYFANLDKEDRDSFINKIFLIVKIGSEVLQDTLRWMVREKDQTVDVFLKDKIHELFHATFKNQNCCMPVCMDFASEMPLHEKDFFKLFHKVKKCKDHGYKCFCCYAANSNPVIREWDVTLTSFFLCRYRAEELKDITYIKKLREWRNNLSHIAKLENIKKLDWQEISHAILEIAKYPSDWNYDKWAETIREQKKNRPSYSDFEKWTLKQKMENQLLKENEAMRKLRDETDNMLKDHEKKWYVKPQRALRHGLDHLEKYNAIFIVGDAGTGKTRFCWELMTTFLKNHHDYTPLILTESRQWDKIKFDRKFIIFIDDIVGKSNLDSGAFESWGRKFDLPSFQSEDIHLIFALRNFIWQLKKDDFRNYKLFQLHNPMDLSGSEFGLTYEEKLTMLEKFCECRNIAVKEFSGEGKVDQDKMYIGLNVLKAIARMELAKSFPYLCEMFFSTKKNIEMGTEFFEVNSANVYEREQVNLILADRKCVHYAILVFLFLNYDNHEDNKILNSKEGITDLVRGIFEIKHVTMPEIRKDIVEMQNSFISVSDDNFRLRHRVTYEAVLMSFGENYPETFLNVINKKVLFEYVRSNGYVAGKHEIVVKLEAEMTESLARKLLEVFHSDIEEAYTEVYKHPAFDDENLVRSFLNIVRGDHDFESFLGSFVAGACNENKDILARETIRTFFVRYKFDPDTFRIVVENDLIGTCTEFLKSGQFIKYLFEGENTTFWTVLLNACRQGSFQCIKDLFRVCIQLGKSNVLNFDMSDTNKLWSFNILSPDGQYDENGWSNMLLKFAY